MRLQSFVYASKALSLSNIWQDQLTSDTTIAISQRPELPGGSPFSLCPVSQSTDIFDINSVELTRQPVHIDEDFTVHIYGTFHKTFGPKAAMTLTVDCGSHCEEYGNPPGARPGESISTDFCELSEIEQPLGGDKKHETCPPEPGYALITLTGFIMPMFFSTPGWYNFTVDAKTAEGERIYCLTTEICLRREDEKKNKHYPPGPWNGCKWPR